MCHCGRGVYLRPMHSDLKGLSNLSIGDGSSIPKGSVFYCTGAPLSIGKKVIFGPRPTIITGNHRIDVVGKYIMDISEKLPENDMPVVIEDDVWVGANVTILKGVTIGRGSVVAAGAVVNRSFPPYSIIGGVPARLLKVRFNPEQIAEHEAKLRHVTIVAPSLDENTNVSGVSAVTKFIIEHNEFCTYEHFLQGKTNAENGGIVSRGVRIAKNYLRWRRWLRKHPLTLIHYNYPLDTLSILRDFFFIRFAVRHHFPVVIHIHGGLYLFMKERPWLIDVILKKVFSWSCPIIVLSEKEKAAIENQFHSCTVHVLPNSIDLDEAHCFHRNPDAEETLHLLYLGRIEPNKGMDYLVAACEELRSRGCKYVLHMAGKDQCNGHYLSLFQEKLSNSFVYEGIVAGEEKVRLLKRCQVFVLPSFYEGLPISLLETMSFGCVPVVTNVGSISEYVQEGVNGLFVKQKDAHSIASAVQQLYQDRDRLSSMSVQAQQTIFDKQDPRQYVSQLNQIYHLCLDFPTKI